MADLRAESRVRLKEAVRRNRALSLEGVLERLFERLFRGLVYTQIWEGPEIDLEALALGPQCRVVAIASGGCNVLSYLTGDPAHIVAVDLSRAHVALNRRGAARASNAWPAASASTTTTSPGRRSADATAPTAKGRCRPTCGASSSTRSARASIASRC